MGMFSVKVEETGVPCLTCSGQPCVGRAACGRLGRTLVGEHGQCMSRPLSSCAYRILDFLQIIPNPNHLIVHEPAAHRAFVCLNRLVCYSNERNSTRCCTVLGPRPLARIATIGPACSEMFFASFPIGSLPK